MLGAALIGAGVATLVHAGYSAVHFQSLIEARYGEVAASLPADVYAELVLAVGLVLAGVAVSVKSFSPLYSDSEPAVNSFHRLFATRQDFALIPKRGARAPVSSGGDGPRSEGKKDS